MCGRYQFSADEYKEIRQIVRDAQRRSEGNELNFPMAGDICPSQVAPVLVSRGEKIIGEFQQMGAARFSRQAANHQCPRRNGDGKADVSPQYCLPALRDPCHRLL